MKNHFDHMTQIELARAFAITAVDESTEIEAGPAGDIIEAASRLPAHQYAEFRRLKDLSLEAIIHANRNALFAELLARLGACASWTATSWEYTSMLVESMRRHMAQVGVLLMDVDMGESRDRLVAQNEAFLAELKQFGEVAKENQARAIELHERERNEVARIVAKDGRTLRFPLGQGPRRPSREKSHSVDNQFPSGGVKGAQARKDAKLLAGQRPPLSKLDTRLRLLHHNPSFGADNFCINPDRIVRKYLY